MSIRPIDLNGMIQRTQDVGTIKQQDDARPMVNQQNIQVTVAKEEQKIAQEVNKKDNAQDGHGTFDAKEKGNSEYSKNSQKREQQEPEIDGKVVVKGMSGGFDIKI